MSAEQPQSTGLTEAQDHITVLLEQLSFTLHSVERLARNGDPATALRLLEDQRAELELFTDDVACAVAAGPRPLPARLRSHAAIIAAAMLTIVSLVASISIAQTRKPDPSNGLVKVARAERIADPSTRLQRLKEVYQESSTMTNGGQVRTRIAAAARRTLDELEDDGRAHPGLLADARELARNADTPQPTSPSQSETPLDALLRLSTN